MNGEDYTARLGVFHSLSPGLKSYISTIAKKTEYQRGEALFLTSENTFFPLIANGKLQMLAFDIDIGREISIGTYREEDFLYHFVKAVPLAGVELYVKFLEDSSVITISEKHFSNLMKLFTDAYLLNLNFTSFHFSTLFKLLLVNTKTGKSI
ncbi:hypothetical protein GCM10022289_01480 [Pedobacter jeongneungensis]|uniref:Uncharacterized protein n=1 Tax=Pedobacter jeongneungensis TaxID=947309 RepID=A0ABP8B1W8_9SPHI